MTTSSTVPPTARPEGPPTGADGMSSIKIKYTIIILQCHCH
jgi:hypothetical protein